MQTVFVKVIGFSDVERHALNTLFRLSEERTVRYALWQAGRGAPAQLALIDSQSYEAQLEFEAPSNAALKMVWIGPGTPDRAWRSFPRPLQWPDVIAAMDELFQPRAELDFDLDPADAVDTQPPEPPAAPKRALIACADRDERLYLRARLSLSDLTQADEAETAADVLELVRRNRYDVALVDFALPGVAGWDLIRRLATARPRIPHLIVTKDSVSAGDRVRAWQAGTERFLAKPPHPGKLKALLDRV